METKTTRFRSGEYVKGIFGAEFGVIFSILPNGTAMVRMVWSTPDPCRSLVRDFTIPIDDLDRLNP